MKKILLLSAIAACTAISVSAQISKGSAYVGGLININNTSNQYDTDPKVKQNSFLISPSIGFAYAENSMWGINLNYGHSKTENTGLNYDLNTYGLGVYLRQYKPMGKGFYFFAQEALNGNYTKGTRELTNLYDVKELDITLGISPGFAYDVSKKFQLEILLNNLFFADYSQSRTKTQSTATPIVTKTNEFGIGSNLSSIAQVGSVSIGARFVFGR